MDGLDWSVHACRDHVFGNQYMEGGVCQKQWMKQALESLKLVGNYSSRAKIVIWTFQATFSQDHPIHNEHLAVQCNPKGCHQCGTNGATSLLPKRFWQTLGEQKKTKQQGRRGCNCARFPNNHAVKSRTGHKVRWQGYDGQGGICISMKHMQVNWWDINGINK